MKNDLDTLLQMDLIEPPVDFTQQVMQRVQVLAQPGVGYCQPIQKTSSVWIHVRRIATLAGLVGGGVVGMSQMVSFVFSMWLTALAI